MVRTALLIILLLAISSCKNTWTQEDKDAFYQVCTEDANKWTISPEQSKTYCDCVFGHVERKYPHVADALEHMDSLAKDPDLLRCQDDIMRSNKK